MKSTDELRVSNPLILSLRSILHHTTAKKAHSLLDEASWIAHIKNSKEYDIALQLMDELIEDYDYNLPLIEILSASAGLLKICNYLRGLG